MVCLARTCRTYISTVASERIELSDEMHINATLDGSSVACVVDKAGDQALFDPAAIDRKLQKVGFLFSGDLFEGATAVEQFEQELTATEKVIRSFMRATQLNEDTLRMKLGVFASIFFDNALPSLLSVGMMEKVHYRGSGNQERYRLAMHMSALQDAMTRSGGSFQRFLEELQR